MLLLVCFLPFAAGAQTPTVKKVQRPSSATIKKFPAQRTGTIIARPAKTARVLTPATAKIETNAPALPAKREITTRDGKKITSKITEASDDYSSGTPRTSGTGAPYNKDGLRCTTTHVEFDAKTINLAEFVSSIKRTSIFPGSIMDLASIQSGGFTPYNAYRAPLRLSTSVMGGDTYRDVAAPTSSTVFDARSKLITRDAAQPISAILDAKSREVYTMSDLSFSLYGRYTNKIADVTAKFNASGGLKSDRRYFIVDFTQAAYVASVDDITKATAYRTAPTGVNLNALAYVDQVTYGRRAIMIVETTSKDKNFKARLDATVNGKTQSGSGGASLDYRKFTSNTDITLLVYGGDEQAGLNAVNFDPALAKNGFRDYVTTKMGGRLSTAVPISYSLRFLANGRSVAVNTLFKTPVEKCLPVTADKALAVRIKSIRPLAIGDSDGREDYRFTQAVTLTTNGKTTYPGKETWTGVDKDYQSMRLSAIQSTALVTYPENRQLRVGSSGANLNATAFYPLLPLDQDVDYELSLTTHLCERSGDGCKGMTPAGGKVMKLNAKLILDALHGSADLSNQRSYPKITTSENEGRANQVRMGRDYAPMWVTFASGNAGAAKTLSSFVYLTAGSGSGRSARVDFEVFLVDADQLAK